MSLTSATDSVLKNCLRLKKGERLFVLVKLKEKQENFFEGFEIGSAFVDSALRMGASANLLFSRSVSDPNRPEDALLNLVESSWAMKKSFSDFDKVTRRHKADFYNPPTAFLIVSGEGYTGKDVVGRAVGYPIPGSREKWNSAFGLLNKFKWNKQAKFDKRKPSSRTALTYAMPVKKFLKCVDVDYGRLARRTRKLFELVRNSEYVYVTSNPADVAGRKIRNDMTFLVKKSWVEKDDGSCFNRGDYLNVPAGEVFLTPESCDGIYIVDGSIHLDRSYLVKKPFAIRVEKGRFTGFEGDKHMINNLDEHISKSRRLLEDMKKSKAVSKDSVRLYEDNFTRIGELGIGTNTRAVLSEFLIEAEKIAGTVHMALGSGYTKERNSVHHDDAVAGARLKINVFADKKQIIKNSKLVV